MFDLIVPSILFQFISSLDNFFNLIGPLILKIPRQHCRQKCFFGLFLLPNLLFRWLRGSGVKALHFSALCIFILLHFFFPRMTQNCISSSSSTFTFRVDFINVLASMQILRRSTFLRRTLAQFIVFFVLIVRTTFVLYVS